MEFFDWNHPAKMDGWMAIFNNVGGTSVYQGYLGTYNGDNDIDVGTGGSNTSGNLNLVTQATPRFIIGYNGRAGLGALNEGRTLNVKGISGDLMAFGVEDPSSNARLLVSNDGHVGINHWYSSATMNVRGVSGDTYAFSIEDPSGVGRFFVGNDGRYGFNEVYNLYTLNIRGISGHVLYFTVEDPNANPFLDILSNGNAIFYNNLTVNGTVSKGGGSFKIDHPLDPTNKNLYHSFVESPDMMNVYNGNVILNGNGKRL